MTSLPRPVPNGPRAADLRRRLVGRLVVLEPLSLDHESGLVDAAQDAEVFTWLPEDMASSAEHLRRWLARAVEAAELGREAPYAILQATTGEPVGSTRFLGLRFEHLRVEIGWTWLARRAWGTGINAETKLLLLGQAFERVGLRRVEFKTDARNERSRRALLAIGAQFEGILRKHMVVRDGGARDSAYYSVIDDDWGRVKALLERRVDASVAKRSGAP